MVGKHIAEFEFQDYSGEFSFMSFKFYPITALNIVSFQTQLDILTIALQGIIIGQLTWVEWVGDETLLSNIAPTNPNATRKLYWELKYEGVTTKNMYFSRIPTADSSKCHFLSDMADMSDPDIASFVTAFEDIARTNASDLEHVTVVYMKLRGRKYKW